MKHKLAHEAGMAYKVLDNELEAKQVGSKRTNELVATVRKIEKLQAKRRKLRRELKRIEKDIKHEKKFLRALAGAV